ncbi:hypothetical protein Lbir_0449 [Legionella birminghamensis]|uniref:Transmembrane protein n=2 Tax=Legionella birminghamensis TaxID=28083 RepID=A0A378IEY9_9GAMM|nr:hypothetical protein Lbir_0449 [Legionella birminghamensis]STX33071.1 Uncharacterised protein [Legionella birminghamensis]
MSTPFCKPSIHTNVSEIKLSNPRAESLTDSQRRLQQRIMSLFPTVKYALFQFKTFLSLISQAWKSYEACRKTLWWPFAFLLLTPLAALILAFIVPGFIAKMGFISDHFMDSKIYLFLLLLLFFAVGGRFVHACNWVSRKHIEKETIDENTGFVRFGIAWQATLLVALCSLLTSIGFALSSLLGIALWFVFLLAANAVTEPAASFKSFWNSHLNLYKNHYGKIIAMGLTRILVLIVFLSPLIIFSFTLHASPTLRFLTGLVAFPLMVYLLIRLIPFYIFLPSYFYNNLLRS